MGKWIRKVEFLFEMKWCSLSKAEVNWCVAR